MSQPMCVNDKCPAGRACANYLHPQQRHLYESTKKFKFTVTGNTVRCAGAMVADLSGRLLNAKARSKGDNH